MTLTILLLAAGSSSRMRGGDKLMELVDGERLIATMARRALRVAPTIITLPALDHPRARPIGYRGATLVPVPDAGDGMSASIRAGVAALPDASAVMILPADMPEITSDDLNTMAKAFTRTPDRIIRATAQDGTPGHPVIFPAPMIPDLMQLSGDEGARSLLSAADVNTVPLPANHATTDLDTPEAWAAWRARSPSSC